ncbi:hypothetical protein [Mesorhizobium sophorae]
MEFYPDAQVILTCRSPECCWDKLRERDPGRYQPEHGSGIAGPYLNL